MTYQIQDTESLSAVELIAERGMEGLPDALAALINEAMRIERERHLRAGSYERNQVRRGYANGYKPKTMKTRMGALPLQVPQVREGGFYPQSLDKGVRSERALKLALAQMYVEGVSTRKVARITEELCGFEVSSSEVSRCAALLDTELTAWRERPLGAYPYVMLDARYEKIRHGGQVIDAAVLVALGVNEDDKRVLTAEQEARIRQTICDKRPKQLKREFALWSRAAVKELIERDCQVTLHLRSVGKYLTRWGFTPQKPIKRVYEQSPEAVRAWLDESSPSIAERAQCSEQQAGHRFLRSMDVVDDDAGHQAGEP